MFFQKHDDDEYGYKMWLSEDEVGDLLDAAHTSKCRLAFQLGVRCGLRSDEIVRIEIRDDGPGIPEAEIRPLSEGRETPLEHTSGLGLWLAHWIVEASEGSLSFEDNDPRGTVAAIELSRAR